MIIFASCGRHKIQCITLMKIFVGQPQPDFFIWRHYQLRDFEAPAYHLILTKHTVADYVEILCICADTMISMFCYLKVFAIKTIEPWSSDCDFNIHSSNLSFVDQCVTVWANWLTSQYITMLFTGLFIWKNIISLFTVSSFPVAYWIPGHKVQHLILPKTFSE